MNEKYRIDQLLVITVTRQKYKNTILLKSNNRTDYMNRIENTIQKLKRTRICSPNRICWNGYDEASVTHDGLKTNLPITDA